VNTNNGVKWKRFIVPKKVEQINDDSYQFSPIAFETFWVSTSFRPMLWTIAFHPILTAHVKHSFYSNAAISACCYISSASKQSASPMHSFSNVDVEVRRKHASETHLVRDLFSP